MYILMNTVKDYATVKFAVNLNRYVGSRNSLNSLSNRACVPNKTEDLNLNVLI